MSGRTMTVAALGAAAGALLGVLALALVAGLVIEGTVTATLISPARSIARPEFVADATSMYILVVLVGAAAGLLIATATAAVMRFLHPEEPRFGPGVLELGGAIAGAILAYVGLRTALGWGGAIVFDEVTGETTARLSVFRTTIMAIGVGGFTGLVTATTVEWLSRPAVVGLEGEAWPSRPAFMKESMAAMLIPIVALLTAAALIFGFSRVLLAGADETVVVVTVFSAVAALVLAGAAFIAAHPPGGRRPPEEQ